METILNLKDTELRLGLPGSDTDAEAPPSTPTSLARGSKRSSDDDTAAAPASKAQVVGWPPIRSYRKNSLQNQEMYVKVSMDGAPYLRKIDIKGYKGYQDLLKAMEEMFRFSVGEYSEREGYKGSDFVPTYEDKDGDWMLVGDVPWEMFVSSCKKLRIVKGSEAKGLGCNM